MYLMIRGALLPYSMINWIRPGFKFYSVDL